MGTTQGNKVGRSILVIDDDKDDFSFVQRSFSDVAPEIIVHHEMNGRNARQRIEDTGASLVLLDLKMPGISGYQVLENLKGADDEDDRINIPVIVLSSSSDTRDVIQCYRQNANAYLEKPSSSAAYRDLARSVKDFWLDQARLAH
ncbi:MAG: response regulator [Pseudomonadota bacterium]